MARQDHVFRIHPPSRCLAVQAPPVGEVARERRCHQTLPPARWHAPSPPPVDRSVPQAVDGRIASSRLLLNAVMQLNHTILEALNGVQIQRCVTMTPRYQWDAVPNENGDHTDDELVDRLRVKKRGDDLATAHQPDILARPRSKAAHKWPDCVVHELHAWRGVRWRMTGENDAPTV